MSSLPRADDRHDVRTAVTVDAPFIHDGRPAGTDRADGAKTLPEGHDGRGVRRGRTRETDEAAPHHHRLALHGHVKPRHGDWDDSFYASALLK